MPSALTEALFLMLPEQEALLASEDGQWGYAEDRDRHRGLPAGARGTVRARRAAALAAAMRGAAAALRAQVDPSGAWRTLHTEHFRLHFRPVHRALADRAAREAERAWRLLAAELAARRGAVDITLADERTWPTVSPAAAERAAVPHRSPATSRCRPTTTACG
jgi:hypothetical protein